MPDWSDDFTAESVGPKPSDLDTINGDNASIALVHGSNALVSNSGGFFTNQQMDVPVITSDDRIISVDAIFDNSSGEIALQWGAPGAVGSGGDTLNAHRAQLTFRQNGTVDGEQRLGNGSNGQIAGGSDGGIGTIDGSWPPAVDTRFRIDVYINPGTGVWSAYLNEAVTAFVSGTFSNVRDGGYAGIFMQGSDTTAAYKWHWGTNADGPPGSVAAKSNILVNRNISFAHNIRR